MKICQKGFSSIIILLVIIVILGVGAGAYYFGKSSNQNIPLSPASPVPTASPMATSIATPVATPTIIPSPTPPNPNSNVFTSQDLGISFNYTNKNTGINGSKIQVKQIGNKVYVYSASGKPEDGQYLEMFSKDKNDLLIDAIKKKILIGYSLNDCLVKTITSTFTGQTHPANFELSQISVPVAPNDDLINLSEKAKKCPASYTAVGGLSYFLFDPAHTDKFIFLSIGQYGIDSGIADKLWQTTIKFLP